jgi:hypothetical protein
LDGQQVARLSGESQLSRIHQELSRLRTLEGGRREREEEYKVNTTKPHHKTRISAVSDPDVGLQRGMAENKRMSNIRR